jgi:UDP-3-O-[3-hydroxymyristoyl] N-acetylglucosamine deacetylase
MKQNTLTQAVSISGVGLHTGENVTATLKPAPENTGLLVVRTDVATDAQHIAIKPENVKAEWQRTMIQNQAGTSVATIEHLLAALFSQQIDNCVIELNGPEVPLLDGSALDWVNLLQEAGITAQQAPAQTVVVRKEDSLTQEQEGLTLEAKWAPYNGLKVHITIDYNHPALPEEHATFTLTPEVFKEEIAAARTFTRLEEIEYARAKGLIKGGSLENAVVYDKDGPINPEGLRFNSGASEALRHKVLDFVGDMATLGQRLQGEFWLKYPGHRFNNAIVNKLIQ